MSFKVLFKDPDVCFTFTDRTAMNKCPFYATKMHKSIQKRWKTLILNFAFIHMVCTFWFLHTLHRSPYVQRPSVICYCFHIPTSLVPAIHLLYPSEMTLENCRNANAKDEGNFTSIIETMTKVYSLTARMPVACVAGPT